ncbi:MAG TPA: PEP-CTERM/exosortase system-associated acyltransferase [Candidatus Omnitrophota bacterium]|nr:PEP-CTERM/exosortase system-associated acyltransferase [Candidatus Omnitrophota bacterium]HQO57917.1 PEP-CTERM/exosortase system-associated acyltransferase [Candidatus Omnitrophota bacterium]
MKDLTYKKVYKDEPQLMEQIYRLRYEVYVTEFGYIKAEHYLDGLEYDKYDRQAQHFAAVDPDGEVVGAVRLILPGDLDLPLEEQCASIYNPKQIYSHVRFGEMSRLIVSKKLRNRRGFTRSCQEKHKALGDHSEDVLYRCFAKCTIIGLCSCVFEESQRLNITHWYALMEKKLYLLLALYGFKFNCIGPEIDYYGSVFPYVVSLSDIERSIHNFISRYGCPILEPHIFARPQRTGWLSFRQSLSRA